jgi:hypothetical protein
MILTAFIVGIVSLQVVSSKAGSAVVHPTDEAHWFGETLQLCVSEILHPSSCNEVLGSIS